MTAPRRERPGLPTRLARGWAAVWRQHRWYFIAPILLTLGVLALLVWLMGPQAVVAFVYAGH